MGAEIVIRLVSDRYDEKGHAPFIGRDFQREITRGNIWEGHHPFLSDGERELLQAPYDQTLDDEYGKPVSPRALIVVLKKVKDYLKVAAEHLPYYIGLDIDRMEAENLDTQIFIDGSRCWIQGDSLLYNIEEHVKFISLPGEPKEVEQWVSVSEEVVVGGEVYYLRKVTRYEKYREKLDEVIAFCEYAISRNEKVYWVYTH